MASKNKSILEEAILDAQRIQDALAANAKEVLRTVANEEINAIVKESLEDSEYDEEDVEDEEGEDDGDDAGFESGDDEAGEEAGEESEIDTDDEIESDSSDEEGSEDYDDMESDVDVEPVGDVDMSDDNEEVMDMTSATDEEVISVYKKLSGEDEIEVVGDEIKLNVSEPGEYVIKTGNGAPAPAPEMGMDDMGAEPEMGMDDMGAEPEMGMGDDMGAEPEMGGDMGDDMGGDEMGAEPEMGGDMEADYEDEDEEVVYEIALDEDIIRTALAEETKIGATANGKVRTATSDVEKSMTGDLASGDIEGQTASKDADSGDNLVGGFDDDAVSHANAEGPTVMNEGEPDEEDEWEDELADGAPSGEEIFEEDELDGDEIDETKKVGGKVKYVGTAHTNEKLQKESVKKYNRLLNESKSLKKENNEFRKTLKTFRGMLAETVVFNSNLTYVTKLFMEHATTKGEKSVILKRFDDEVSTIKESKKLYKSVNNELKSRKPINESVNGKIIKGGGSSSSKSLNESTVYVDPSTARMLDLINRVETREQ